MEVYFFVVFPHDLETIGDRPSGHTRQPKIIHKGAFVETVKGWQQEWFYITEPRDITWAATPEFKSRPPMRLTSWINKGLDWASSDEVMTL